MSKNPPLTEDQIRQSAEAEARHAATQAPRPPGLHDRAAEAAAGRRRARGDRRLRGGLPPSTKIALPYAMSRRLSGHNLQDISRDVPPSALRNVMADTPGALSEVPAG
ncbi:MAG TPA: hypothetical protein VI036_07115 [Propionibacteriaceae bacterium]